MKGAHTWSEDGRLLVVLDLGGSALGRLAHWRRMERDGVRTSVLGTCASACTLVLGNSGTCSAHAAAWMFHRTQAHGEHPMLVWGIQHFAEATTDWTLQNYYPEGLGAWEARIPKGQDVWVTGAQLIEAGWVEACEDLPNDPDWTAHIQRILNAANQEGHLQGAELAALLILPRNTKALTVEATARRP